ncbi:hypothetical protein FG93_03294 [Bosea sp. LC85]|uniref:S1 family peptidase n=1 Tax=Bosea sp. LC85 TaxID=1502851 RepID=UPI0004E2E42E|nr:serine protease [Bosea sp. LC85]KFC69248.1 hypothetical protein FG93_03294 [Bosea sp. LC85]
MVRWISATLLLAIACVSIHTAASAKSPHDILAESAEAIVFLEAQDTQGKVLITGTGFIVSRDGYVVTVAHNFSDGAAKLFAVIGARQGVRFQLDPREMNIEKDVAVWQLPQSSSCRHVIPLSATQPKVFDGVLAVGFPGDAGLTPNPLSIQNPSTRTGLIRGNGLLQPGYSGGPVLNESGEATGIVQGGTIAGAQANDFVPIAVALDLIRRRTMVVEPGKIEPCLPAATHSKTAPAWNLKFTGIYSGASVQTNKSSRSELKLEFKCAVDAKMHFECEIWEDLGPRSSLEPNRTFFQIDGIVSGNNFRGQTSSRYQQNWKSDNVTLVFKEGGSSAMRSFTFVFEDTNYKMTGSTYHHAPFDSFKR